MAPRHALFLNNDDCKGILLYYDSLNLISPFEFQKDFAKYLNKVSLNLLKISMEIKNLLLSCESTTAIETESKDVYVLLE